MNKFLNATILALAVLAVLSYGGASFAHAQNTTTGTTTTTTSNYPRDHDQGHDHFGLNLNHLASPFLGGGERVRTHIGLGLGVGVGLPSVGTGVGAVVTNNPPATTTSTVVTNNPPSVVREHYHDHDNFAGFHDFARFHDFAQLHHDHFIIINGAYTLLPETVACPPGSQLNVYTGECQIVNQILVQQAAPTILQEQVTPSITEQQATTVTTNSVAPIISCPAGSTQVGDQCQITTQSTQTVAPLLSCNAGFTLSAGQCVEQQQQIIVGQSCGCPDGSSSVNGQCVVNALPSQVTVGTTPGEIIVLGHHFHHEGGLPWIR